MFCLMKSKFFSLNAKTSKTIKKTKPQISFQQENKKAFKKCHKENWKSLSQQKH